ncbi:facilitated trehalose transporter Tret1-like isoform X2 [Bacillus rossius redtenbacheri]
MEDEVARKIWFRHWPQHLAAFLAAQSTTCAGAVLGWTSPVLPTLRDVTPEQASWVASLTPLGALLGAALAGWLADALGRKRAILATALPFFAGSLLTAVSRSALVLYCARFISGLAIGVATTVVPMYSEEVAEPKLRGALGVYLEITLNVGILWSYVAGYAVSYVWFTATSTLLPVIFFFSFLWMPESPVYLMSTGREEDAERSLRWLRGAKTQQTSSYTTELSQLKKTFLTEKDCSVHFKGRLVPRLADFARNISLSSPTSKACFIIFGLIFFQQAGGIDAVTFYVVSILQDAGTVVSPFASGAIVGVIQLLASGVSFLTVDRLGRRVLLLTSLVSMCLSHFLLSLNFALKETLVDSKFYSWMPLFSMCVYFVTFSLGLGPLPWLMMAELAPTESKEAIGSVAITFSWTLAFVVSKFFGSMFELIGSLLTYALFSGMCLLGTIFVAFFVPETKGKTREEIEKYFSKDPNIKTLTIL